MSQGDQSPRGPGNEGPSWEYVETPEPAVDGGDGLGAGRNGLEAFIAASSDAPDIIVSDVVIPVMDGIRLVRALREAPMLVHIPVILTTGVNVPEGLPVQALLRKPFVAAHLLSLIYRLVDTRSKPESFSGDLGHSEAVGGDERKS